jgi:nucleotide-binding universal stress UspA family protein
MTPLAYPPSAPGALPGIDEAACREEAAPPARILFATDGSSCSQDAAAVLAALPLPPGTWIHVLLVVDPFVDGTLEALGPGRGQRAAEMLDIAAAPLRRAGWDVSVSLRVGDADHQLLLTAAEDETDLIVLGSHGRTGLPRLLIGSVAESVAHHARCPVLVARAPRGGPKRVVLAVDASEHSRQATELLAGLPLPEGTEVQVLHITRPLFAATELGGVGDALLLQSRRYEEEERMGEARRLVEAAAERLERAGKKATPVVQSGDAAAQILASAEHADLIVAGARGDSRFRNLLVGSVADRLLRKAGCSVLLVR